MLVQNLAITYKCYTSIGNSLDLKEMINQALRTFVSETYAIYATYYIENEKKELDKLTSFGRSIEKFEVCNYKNHQDEINHIKEEDKIVLILRLNHGSIFLVSQNIDVDCSFFLSMFQSFIPKLNLSIKSCLNVQKMQESNILLKKQKEELKVANKAKDDFLANMSHELKTPLNSISVISSVMKRNKKQNLTEQQIKNLEIIKKSSKNVLSLINEILDLSKLEAGEITLEYTKININDFMQNIYEMILAQTKEKGLKLSLDIDKNLDFIYSDENRINQIIINLLSNSIKFTDSGEIKISVKDDNQLIKIIVEDEGIGIPKEKLENIFDRFKQVDGDTTRKYGGTGLGLAICKELAILLKGDITVSSILNKGSSFELIIPKENNSISYTNTTKLGKTDIKDSIDLIDSKNEKESIILYNNNPILFLSCIIKLKKKYLVIQEQNFDKFLELNRTKKMKKAILDTSNLSKLEIETFSNIKENNFISIFEEEADNKFKEKSLLMIKKELLNNYIDKI